jgi:hypothetical protein
MPEWWQPGQPVFVSFYQSDNYSGAWRPSDWMGTQAFVGHRFKQLLVNHEVVWEQDVADEEITDPAKGPSGTPKSGYKEPYRAVDISRYARRETTLTFRVVDKVPSTTTLPGDAYKRFWWSAHDPTKVAQNFLTTAYFGDVHVTSAGEIVRPEAKPPAAGSGKGRPGKAVPTSGIRLELVAPERLPSPGWPVRCGVPLPQGAVAAGKPFGLKDPAGTPVPAVMTETSHWPDSTIRWLLCEFVASQKGTFRLVPGVKPSAPPSPVRVRSGKEETLVSNGILRIRLGRRRGDGIWEDVRCADGPDLGAMELAIKLNRVGWRDEFTAQRSRVTIERANPVCVTLRIDGDMLHKEEGRFGSFRGRIHVWAGLPFLIVEWRLVNESDQSMAMLLDWSARIGLPGLDEALLDFGPFEPGYEPDDIGVKAMGHYDTIENPRQIPLHSHSELRCVQERGDQARIYRNTAWSAKAERAPGFVNVRHPNGGLVASMRWFAEEFPKGVVVRPDRLVIGTLPESVDALGWAHDRPWLRMGRGEAKRQVFALWLHDGSLSSSQAERFNACIQDSPYLFEQQWFISSGALETGPARDHPRLAAYAAKTTPEIERTGIGAPRLGHREYWDTCWSNDYRGRAHLALLQFVETGDPRWFRYFDAACTHNRDVDIIHYCPEHPDWVGAIHQYGEDHTTCGPMSNIGLNCDSLLDHYLLTGDPDSLEAARGLAEQVMTCSPWARSARAVGWPLAQIVRWYEQTGERRFLRKANELVEAATAYIEPRRGIFSEYHGCWSYHGSVPFMVGYLAFGLIRYHRLTGSPEVLRLLEQLARGLFAESFVGQGRFRYSPFPENNRFESYRAWNGLIGGLTGYLYQVTGKKDYAEWTQVCYDAIVEDAADMNVTMDMLQTAGWMLHAVAGAPGGRRGPDWDET